LRAECWTKFCT